MSWTIEWLSKAEQELADVWLKAADRKAITAAAQAIDDRLRLDPPNEGESRWDDLRITFSKPLGVLFQVRPADRLVLINHVWHYK